MPIDQPRSTLANRLKRTIDHLLLGLQILCGLAWFLLIGLLVGKSGGYGPSRFDGDFNLPGGQWFIYAGYTFALSAISTYLRRYTTK